MSAQPLPCPFCGTADLEVDGGVDQDAFLRVGNQAGGYHHVECFGCGADQMVGYPRTREEAVAAWNKRVSAVIPGPLARKVRKLWSDLERETSCPVPHAGATPQESFIMSWDHGRHHLEVEIFTEGRHEWFYCDRETDLCEGSEGNRQQAVAAVTGYLKRFA